MCYSTGQHNMRNVVQERLHRTTSSSEQREKHFCCPTVVIDRLSLCAAIPPRKFVVELAPHLVIPTPFSNGYIIIFLLFVVFFLKPFLLCSSLLSSLQPACTSSAPSLFFSNDRRSSSSCRSNASSRAAFGSSSARPFTEDRRSGSSSASTASCLARAASVPPSQPLQPFPPAAPLVGLILFSARDTMIVIKFIEGHTNLVLVDSSFHVREYIRRNFTSRYSTALHLLRTSHLKNFLLQISC